MGNMRASILSSVKKAVQSIDPQAEIILFGSHARGDARPDSDWDFLILLESFPNDDLEDSIRNELYELELGMEQVISAVIEQKKIWDDLAITPLYKNIKNEGVLL